MKPKAVLAFRRKLMNYSSSCSFVVIQSLSRFQLFATSWPAARQASLSFTVSQSLLRLMSIELVMLSSHIILCRTFSCPQSFPASRSFPVSWLFPSGGQSTGASASASVLSVSIQGESLPNPPESVTTATRPPSSEEKPAFQFEM